MKYATYTKAEMVEILKARGYGRVSTRLSKCQLTMILEADDEGRVNEKYW